MSRNILTDLRDQGITLSLAGDSLKFKSTQGVTPEQKELLRKNKAEIMRLLREEQMAEATEQKPEQGNEQTTEQRKAAYGILHDLCVIHCVRIAIDAGGDGFIFTPPTKPLPDDLRAKIEANKQALLSLLGEIAAKAEQDRMKLEEERRLSASVHPSQCFTCRFEANKCEHPEIRTRWGLMNFHDCAQFKWKEGASCQSRN